MNYNYDFELAALALQGLITYYLIQKKGLGRDSNKIYLATAVCLFIATLADICNAVVYNTHDPDAVLLLTVTNYVFLIFHNLVAFLFMMYVIEVLGITYRFEGNKRILLYMPFTADVVLFALNPLFKWLFWYDDSAVYYHGPMFSVVYAVAFIHMCVSIVMILVNKDALTPEKRSPFALMVVISLVPVVIQMLVPTYMLSIFFESIGLLGILYSIENRDELYNPVTNVRNRTFFLHVAKEAIQEDGAYCLMIKLSGLKYYNATVGVESVNDILQQIGSWLKNLTRDAKCYDYGAGRFVMMFDRSTPDQIEEFLHMIEIRFAASWESGDMKLEIPIQHSIFRLKDDIKSVEELVLVLDTTFDGTENEAVVVSDMLALHQRRILVETLIRKAIKNKSFRVYYQPIWDRKTGRVQSAEALIRLIDDEYGFIPPDEFIPIAEQDGMIMEIGEYVFDEVCRFYKENELQKAGIERIEVNLSLIQCMNRKLSEQFYDILNRYGLDAGSFNLEITESAAAGNTSALMNTIDDLTELGFTFSLDDYGTGYSNISYMYEFPFSIIKLDKSILWSAMSPRDSSGDSNAMVILENTLVMMKRMDYQTLVEGVETEEQKNLLEDLGCDLLQGYYFSRPVPGDEFIANVRSVNEG